MADLSAELLEKIRRQFDTAPYPKIALDQSPKGDLKYLYPHDLAVPYYNRNQRVISSAGKVILDAGCGSGYKALALAEANPGAKIVGVDLSDESVKLARERLKYHGFENAEFHTLTIEALPSLGLEFDYINCDEVLYLLPDPVVGLQAMKAVLKSDGIIRANFHHRLQRAHFHQAQEFFTRLGLMEQSPNETELTAVREVMKALKSFVLVKERTWRPEYEENDDLLLANHLLRGDKGTTIPEFFSILRQADLEFINMVNWWQWDLVELFEDFSELPVEVALTFADKSIEEQLHLFALIHPCHRLLDLWCGHPGQSQPYTAVENWTEEQWRKAKVHLYSQFKVPVFKQEMINAIESSSFLEISRYFHRTPELINLDSLLTACLLPLLDAPQSVATIAQRWKQLRPLNLVTLQPTTDAEAFEVIKQRLTELEQKGYILLELAD
ncbi:MAG: class I SAM-dependent methyltransferase [Leptolyngbyaceae cyanobacterium bins.302]|nr:class I SAM-dependent methyltransferase [Leptolyngbyaceae cyanobacterium bins.302]